MVFVKKWILIRKRKISIKRFFLKRGFFEKCFLFHSFFFLFFFPKGFFFFEESRGLVRFFFRGVWFVLMWKEFGFVLSKFFFSKRLFFFFEIVDGLIFSTEFRFFFSQGFQLFICQRGLFSFSKVFFSRVRFNLISNVFVFFSKSFFFPKRLFFFKVVCLFFSARSSCFPKSFFINVAFFFRSVGGSKYVYFFIFWNVLLEIFS